MSRKLASTKVILSTQQNPWTPTANVLVDHQEQLCLIKDKIKKLVRDHGLMRSPNNVDMSTLIQLLGDDFHKGVSIFKAMRKAEPDVEVFPPPPPPMVHELYNRVSRGSKVMDVGSGDGEKLKLLVSQVRLRTCDKSCVSVLQHFGHLKETFSPSLLEEDELVVSRLCLNQNADVSPFMDVDGIHVVPNLPVMESLGLSTKNDGEDKGYTTKMGKESFLDYDHSLPGQIINSAYLGVNTFKPRKIELKHIGESSVSYPYCDNSVGIRPTHQVDLVDHTTKYDGVLCYLKCVNGRAMLLDRGATKGPIFSTDDISFGLYLEKFEGRYILVKVSDYRGMEPFHSTETLRFFLSRVKIKIMGIEVEPPKLEEESPEGFVVRKGGQDFLVRKFRSFDITPGSEGDFISYCETLGHRVSFGEVGPVDSVNEYILKDSVMVFHKQRPDKKNGDHNFKIKKIFDTFVLSDLVEFERRDDLTLEDQYGEDDSYFELEI